MTSDDVALPLDPTSEAAQQLQEETERERAIALALNFDELKYRKIALYEADYWNPKQRDFFALQRRFRLFMAGNQLGKTLAGGFEWALHLTGLYPDWWPGHRFTGPISTWVGGINGVKLRDNAQLKLMGRSSDWGTGFIPRDHIAHEPSRSKGTTGLIDQLEVNHVKGGTSYVKFMSYDSDDDVWESDTLHGIWYDEEPPETKYVAGLARLTVTLGIDYLTFTPLLGMSSVVRRYYPRPETQERGYVQAGMRDVTHIPEDRKAEVIRNYPRHERKARVYGEPTLGSGAVYTVDPEVFEVTPAPVPDYWPRIRGLDIGGGSASTAWVEGALDRENDILYLVREYKQTDPRISTHAASMTQAHGWVPVAWPHDGNQHEKTGDGLTYAMIYRNHGVPMLPSHSCFDDGGYSPEAGISLIEERLAEGRLKVHSTCTRWLEEYRLYHREKGRIVKEDDHLMDATRQVIMALAQAKTAPRAQREMQTSAGMDYDPLRGIA